MNENEVEQTKKYVLNRLNIHESNQILTKILKKE